MGRLPLTGSLGQALVLGLYLYDEGQVRLWPYPRANGEHTIQVLQRLQAEAPERPLIVLWDGRAVSPGQGRPGGRHDPGHRPHTAARLQPGSDARGGALALAAGRTSPITTAMSAPRT